MIRLRGRRPMLQHHISFYNVRMMHLLHRISFCFASSPLLLSIIIIYFSTCQRHFARRPAFALVSQSTFRALQKLLGVLQVLAFEGRCPNESTKINQQTHTHPNKNGSVRTSKSPFNIPVTLFQSLQNFLCAPAQNFWPSAKDPTILSSPRPPAVPAERISIGGTYAAQLKLAPNNAVE